MSLKNRLNQRGCILADGAMGTMLFQRGLKQGDCPERMNLERPEILEEIARLYAEAGAEIVQTNTFGGSPLKLAGYGLAEKTEEINARAVGAARNGAGHTAYISASCGPCGKMLAPYGDARAEEVYESFRRQMQALVREGVDMICIETMIDSAEAVLAIQAAKAVDAAIPVCASLVFDPTPKGFRTIMGTTIEQAIRQATSAGVDIVGSNCGNGIVNMIAIAEEFMKNTTLPVLIQSNAGLPALKDGAPWYPDSPGFMAEQSRLLKQIGVKIIGGCCGTTPAHIAAMRQTLG